MEIINNPLDSLNYWTKNLLLFVLHVGIWTLWTLLIRFSQVSGEYSYDTTTVIMMTEITKLILSMCFHFLPIKSSLWSSEARSIVFVQWRMGVYFAVPAFIYALYNTLFFLNLQYFDPVSYRVLINIRILWSGLLFQFFFSRRLGMMKWIALCLLMLGCAANQVSDTMELETDPFRLLAIGFQAFCSSFGGVYSELLLKKNIDISLNVKNMYLYMFSILFNAVFIVIAKPHLLSYESFFSGYTNATMLIILVGAFCGFSTSLFLRHLNIILKEYAHSGEMFATAIAFWVFFDTPIEVKVIVSMVLVAVSVFIYNKKSEPQPLPPAEADVKDDSEEV